MRRPRQRIVGSTRLSWKYAMKWPRIIRNKRIKNATEVFLEQDLIERSFQEFRTKIFSKPQHTDELIRIFIWNLIRKIQDDHALLRCAKHINKTTVAVVNGLPVIVGRKRKYSMGLAKKNYKDLKKFLSKEFFGADNVPPYCMKDFLELLISEDSLAHQFLIARHYAILSNRSRISFVSNLVVFPRSMPHQLRVRFFKVVDNVEVEGNWANSIKENDTFLKMTIERIPYEPDCPPTKSFGLLMFHRSCHHHVGIKKRTSFVESAAKYRAWVRDLPREQRKYMVKKVMEIITRENKNPELNQNQLVMILLERFPTYLTRLQRDLHENNLLAYFCINPCDRLRC